MRQSGPEGTASYLPPLSEADEDDARIFLHVVQPRVMQEGAHRGEQPRLPPRAMPPRTGGIDHTHQRKTLTKMTPRIRSEPITGSPEPPLKQSKPKRPRACDSLKPNASCLTL